MTQMTRLLSLLQMQALQMILTADPKQLCTNPRILSELPAPEGFNVSATVTSFCSLNFTLVERQFDQLMWGVVGQLADLVRFRFRILDYGR